jgi:hypothetical protein
MRLKSLLAASLVFIFEGTNAQTYHYYFGTQHAHSGYSDGKKIALHLTSLSKAVKTLNFIQNLV